MKLAEIEKAKQIAMVFVNRCNKLKGRADINFKGDALGCGESGAVRRASMELTRQLAKMRK